MTIQEMHNVFRTLGQQMGIQQVRGILDESIDVYLNDAIIEKTRVELLQSVITNTKVSNQQKVSTMSSINTFRNLFRTARYAIDKSNIAENSKVNTYNPTNGFYIINIPIFRPKADININDDECYINPIMILGCSVEYDTTQRGNAVNCRVVGSDEIENTINDYCSRPSKDYPVVCLNSNSFSKLNVELSGIEVNTQLEVYTCTKDCNIKFLNIKYIKKPNVVKLNKVVGTNIDCDLPDYLHDEIVEMAVRKYQTSIGINTNSQNRN